MTKAELVDRVAKAAGLTKRAGLQAVNAFVDTVSAAMSKGDKVTLVGFGTFDVTTRKARKARNPRTGQVINVPSKRVPRFRAGTELKKKVR
ncbi:HU family DNA-binding protein [candidate division WOR-3 bacterium]|nr:HU family DNA-binding protein [candidate division WOR-3 bacterium]